MAFDNRLLAGVGVLMAIVEAGTIARAAETLGLTASGVSRALARLEARVGIRLLDRTTRSLTLTDEGRRFYERVGPHLAEIEEAALEAGGAASRVRGRLRVNVDPFFSRILLADRVTAFLDRYPEIALDLIMRERIGDLVVDGFDLAIRFGEPPSGAFTARKLTDTRVMTVAAPAYLARHGRPAHPNDLAGHLCIDFYDPATGRPYEWEFRRGVETLPVRPRSRLHVSDSSTMVGACEAGGGIAQILELGNAPLLASGKLVELFADWPDETFPLYALFPSRRHRAAKVNAFVDFILEVIAGATSR